MHLVQFPAEVADEAHSSQTGDAAAKLKQVLSPEEIADLGDGGEVSMEDILAAQMAARANVKTVLLTHQTYRPDGDYSARAAEVKRYFSGEVLVAKDLMEF